MTSNFILLLTLGFLAILGVLLFGLTKLTSLDNDTTQKWILRLTSLFLVIYFVATLVLSDWLGVYILSSYLPLILAISFWFLAESKK